MYAQLKLLQLLKIIVAIYQNERRFNYIYAQTVRINQFNTNKLLNFEFLIHNSHSHFLSDVSIKNNKKYKTFICNFIVTNIKHFIICKRIIMWVNANQDQRYAHRFHVCLCKFFIYLSRLHYALHSHILLNAHYNHFIT